MSHTLKAKVKMKAGEALARTVEKLGGRLLGEGQHSLYASTEQGIGFNLPGWKYPLILRDDGTLAYDDYHGQWGNVNDLTRLNEEYALEAARAEAERLGWMTEDLQNGDLLICHPEGGSLTVTREGRVEATGFHGAGCQTATEAIGNAIGHKLEEQRKAEYYDVRARQMEPEGEEQA